MTDRNIAPQKSLSSHGSEPVSRPDAIEFASQLGLIIGGWLAEQAVEGDTSSSESSPARSHRC